MCAFEVSLGVPGAAKPASKAEASVLTLRRPARRSSSLRSAMSIDRLPVLARPSRAHHPLLPRARLADPLRPRAKRRLPPALSAFAEYAGLAKDKRMCRLLAEELDEPIATNVNAGNNPPASACAHGPATARRFVSSMTDTAGSRQSLS